MRPGRSITGIQDRCDRLRYPVLLTFYFRGFPFVLLNPPLGQKLRKALLNAFVAGWFEPHITITDSLRGGGNNLE